jgi:hypothetical protein
MSNRVVTEDDVEPVRGTGKRGYVTALNGKPLMVWLTTFQLGDARKLFRHRAAQRGATPTVVEIDDAVWLTMATGKLPKLYEPVP